MLNRKSTMPSIVEKRKTFRQLHDAGCFALPNPWDLGTARYLQHLGFKAIATTSAGFAFSRALPDYAVSLDLMLAHYRDLVEAVDIPVNADFENGFADEPADVAHNVRRCVDTGVAGLSVEDSTRGGDEPLYDVDFAAERISAARDAIGNSNVILVARTECFLAGKTDLSEVIRRLTAFARAGADCLYAPGIRTRDEIRAVVECPDRRSDRADDERCRGSRRAARECRKCVCTRGLGRVFEKRSRARPTWRLRDSC